MSERTSSIESTSRSQPLGLRLSASEQAAPWSHLRAARLLTLLPSTSEGRLVNLLKRRVYVVKTQGDASFGRLLWSGKRVVLSRLHPESEEHKDRQLADIRSQLKLRHRNVQRMYGTCELDGEVLLVQPQLDGWPLRAYLQETRTADRRAIVLDVARGLQYLHSQGIVHGDMTMCNVSVARDGPHALLATSFGPRPTLATASRSYWATDAYHDSDASPSSESDPELDTVVPRRCQRFFAVTREGRPDPAARAFLYSTDQHGDLFAFGHFVVEVFTEIAPYGSESALEILRRSARGRRPRHPGKVALTRGLDKLLWRICRRCWAPDVGPHARDIVEALERPRDDVLVCPFEWSSEDLHQFIWKRVRRVEVEVVTRVTIGRDAEDGRYELRALCRGARVLKLIPYWAHRRDLRGNIFSELFVWCQLQHAHIAPLAGVCHNPFDNNDCFAVPWMGGGTCVDYLREHPDANRLAIAAQVADALAYLHTRAPPVMHGRVRAHSVWMTADGTAYLCNFDFQPQRHPERGFDDSDVRSIVASANWAAPEHGPSGLRRDIFSFAMFMYELYAGHAPFPEKDLVEVFCAYAANERPDRPDHPQLADGVWELMRRCWRAAPYRRPAMKTVFRRLKELQSEHV